MGYSSVVDAAQALTFDYKTEVIVPPPSLCAGFGAFYVDKRLIGATLRFRG
jgi:hypothetical protein